MITALRERLARLGRGERSDRDSAELMAKIMAIGEHCASLPVLDPRTADELLGYDECGLTH